jgi:hypothetical protein
MTGEVVGLAAGNAWVFYRHPLLDLPIARLDAVKAAAAAGDADNQCQLL